MRHLVILSIALLAGCNFNLDTESKGELGNATFSYQSSQCGFLDCGTDKSVLQGSKITVVMKGDHASEVSLAVFQTASIGRIVDANPSCVDGGSCQYTIDIETTGAGDGSLEVYDAKGALIDKTTVRVKPASRIELGVSVNNQNVQAKDDVYEVPRGTEVDLSAKVFDDAGNELLFTEHGVQHDYADRAIVQPSSSPDLFGSTDVEEMEAEKAGDTSVTTRATGAQAVAKFRVLP
jgi:hypothetical protein